MLNEEIMEVLTETNAQRTDLSKRVRAERRCNGLRQQRLTDKQIESRHGQMKSIKLDRPCTWDEFCSVTEGTRLEYYKALRTRYEARVKDICTMFGVSHNTLMRRLPADPEKCFDGVRAKSPSVTFISFLMNNEIEKQCPRFKEVEATVTVVDEPVVSEPACVIHQVRTSIYTGKLLDILEYLLDHGENVDVKLTVEEGGVISKC